MEVLTTEFLPCGNWFFRREQKNLLKKMIVIIGHTEESLRNIRKEYLEIIKREAEVLQIAPVNAPVLYNAPPIKPIVWENISVSRHSKGKSYKNKKLNHYE
jgi:hypothetical protein